MQSPIQALQHLLEANRILASTLDPDELLRRITELAREVVDTETASLLLLDEKTQRLVFALALADCESSLKAVRLKIGEGIAGCAARERQAQIVNDVKADPRWDRDADTRTDFTTRSVLAVPLVYRDQLIGVIEAINKTAGPFSTDDVAILEAFASQAAVAVVNARVFARFQKETVLQRNFLSLISHKLRTPLVAITGYGHLLLDDVSLSEFQRKAVISIHRQGNHLAGLIDKLLSYTIIESNQLTLRVSPSTLEPVIDETLCLLAPYIRQQKAQVAVNDEVAALPAVMMEPEKIATVLRNLVENAIKFNRGPSRTVQIEPCREEGLVGLAVRDNGPGIDAEEHERIFEKFYQIEESFTGQVEGAGLGLSVVRYIVQAHGGRVGVQSAPGQGSLFYFVLPVAS